MLRSKSGFLKGGTLLYFKRTFHKKGNCLTDGRNLNVFNQIDQFSWIKCRVNSGIKFITIL